MSLQQILLILLIGAATYLYLSRRLPTEVVSLLVIAVLGITGLLDAGDALSGFSSTAMVTVAAMFVLSGGLLRTGALEALTLFLTRTAQGNPRRLLLSIGLIAAISSAFINNTPVVVMMVPIMLSLSSQLKIRPSKLLIPLSYFSVLGGTMTLLGTSTNILLDDLYRKAGGPGFGIFEFAPLGIIFTLVGTIYVVMVSWRLLPDRSPLSELVDNRRPNTYLTEVVVSDDSAVAGQTVKQVFERIATAGRRVPAMHRQHRRIGNVRRRDPKGEEATRTVELVELFRDRRVYRAEETATETLQGGDALLIAGTPGALTQFVEASGTYLAPLLADGARVAVDDVERKVMEAVVLPNSAYNGTRIGDLELNRLYGVHIMGLQHHGRQMMSGLRDMRLASGDVLLLQARPAGLRAASDSGSLMLVEGVETNIPRTTKNRVAILIMLLVVATAALTSIPIAVLALAGAAAMIISKCLRVDEALRSLDSGTLLLLAATIPLGIAMETTGLARLIVDGLLQMLRGASPLIVLSVFYLMTNLLTQVLSNNAVAVLLMPIGLNLSVTLGISPTPLLMAIAFGASASFMTPMGYQTNAIVMGPGGYRFGDYLRIGIPLSIIMWLLATVMIPILYPL